MSKKNQEQPGPKPFKAWGLYNWGHPRGAFPSRKEAMNYAETMSGEEWAKCSLYHRIARVTVAIAERPTKARKR